MVFAALRDPIPKRDTRPAPAPASPVPLPLAPASPVPRVLRALLVRCCCSCLQILSSWYHQGCGRLPYSIYMCVYNIHIYIYEYVCVCTVCMDGWIDGWMDGWMYGCTDVWTNGCMYGYMDVWMHGWMDGCTHAWMHACNVCDQYHAIYFDICHRDIQLLFLRSHGVQYHGGCLYPSILGSHGRFHAIPDGDIMMYNGIYHPKLT